MCPGTDGTEPVGDVGRGMGCRKSWELDVGDWLFLRAAGMSEVMADEPGGGWGAVVIRVRVRVQWFSYCCVKPRVSGYKPLIPILK